MLRLLAIGVVAGAAAFPFPQVIKLPNGFQPEGIEVGKGNTFYVGSRLTGAIYRGNLRTGGGQELIAGGAGRPATGIELDPRNRLFVAGAGSGGAWVYSANPGGLIRAYNNVASAPTFINDVVVTPKGAYFTDSQKAVL